MEKTYTKANLRKIFEQKIRDAQFCGVALPTLPDIVDSRFSINTDPEALYVRERILVYLDLIAELC